MSPIQLSIQSQPQSGASHETRGWLESLNIGQRLSARVIAQAGPGQLTLRIGGQTLVAKAQVPLGVGSVIEVVVAKTSPGVLLRTVQSPSIMPASAGRAAISETSAPLPVALSKAGGALPELLIQVSNLQAARALPPALAPLVNKLMSAVNESSALADSAGLRAAMLGSGIWMEALLGSSLVQDNHVSDHDIKMLLARLLVSLRTVVADQPGLKSMAELEASVKSSLLGITGNQLKSAGSESSQTWYLTLPFIWHDEYQHLQMSIWRDPEPDRSPDEPASDGKWQVRLHLESAGTGRLEIEIGLSNGVVRVNIVGDSIAAIERMTLSQGRLAQALARSGLEFGGLNTQLRAGTEEQSSSGVDTNV